MAAAPAPNSRASLLSGLRTGGVRSASHGQVPQVPYTAAPGGSFSIPSLHQSTGHQQRSSINGARNGNPYDAEDEDELADSFSQTLHLSPPASHQQRHQAPMTASLDQQFFAQQAQQQQVQQPLNDLQMLQLQRMQLEMLRFQQQQVQYQMLAAAQQQQRQNSFQGGRRVSAGPALEQPATAAPAIQSFAAAAQLRAAARQAQSQVQSQLEGYAEEQQVPMSAALGGKFGSRGLNPYANVFNVQSNGRFGGLTGLDGMGMQDDANGFFNGVNGSGTLAPSNSPATPGYTSVLSGGTSLGVGAKNGGGVTQSKSDSATSWRRAANQDITPSVKVSPPPSERPKRTTPSPPAINGANAVNGATKSRPQPLKFNISVSQPLPSVAIDNNSADDESSSSESATVPTTPPSGGPPLSPREEATKRLFEGLGIGRPTPQIPQIVNPPAPLVPRVVSQPLRQPRGPPAGADELGPQNFASRIRAKAVGNLGVLLDARERRDVVGAF